MASATHEPCKMRGLLFPPQNNQCCLHVLLWPSPELLKRFFLFSAVFIRRPRGPLLQARPRVINHSHRVQPTNCLSSLHKPPTACSCSKLRPSVTRLLLCRVVGRTHHGCFSFQQTGPSNRLSDTRLTLLNYARLSQQPPLRVYL